MRKIVPALPTTQHTCAETAAPAIRFVVTSLDCELTAPARLVRKISPSRPIAHDTDRSGAMILVVPAGSPGALEMIAREAMPVVAIRCRKTPVAFIRA